MNIAKIADQAAAIVVNKQLVELLLVLLIGRKRG
jgi:hypothetical protein